MFAAAKKFRQKAPSRAEQRADIGDQQGLAEQPQPFAPAPEPLAEIGPDPLAGVECEDAVEIADEVADIGEERAQIDLRADRGEQQCGGEHHGSEQEPPALARDRLAIGGVEHGELLLGKDRNRDGHLVKANVHSEEKEPGPSTRLQWHSPETQDAFFLRSASTNLISSIVPS